MTRKLNLVLRAISHLCWLISGFFIAIFYLSYRVILPKKQGSHPISRFFRRIFEHQKARTYWGVILFSIILAINFNLSRLEQGYSPHFNKVMAAPKQALTTETSYQKPVSGWVSFGYCWYHQAIDIATELGDDVYPIAEGVVVSVEHKPWGYGHFLVIKHEAEYQSLYAHLNEIKIKPGDHVDKRTLLGDIGMTGFTTGPHLHLEVYEQGKAINPTSVLPGMPVDMAYDQ